MWLHVCSCFGYSCANTLFSLMTWHLKQTERGGSSGVTLLAVKNKQTSTRESTRHVDVWMFAWRSAQTHPRPLAWETQRKEKKESCVNFHIVFFQTVVKPKAKSENCPHQHALCYQELACLVWATTKQREQMQSIGQNPGVLLSKQTSGGNDSDNKIYFSMIQWKYRLSTEHKKVHISFGYTLQRIEEYLMFLLHRQKTVIRPALCPSLGLICMIVSVE